MLIRRTIVSECFLKGSLWFGQNEPLLEPYGERITTAGVDGVVQIYTTDMDELLQIAESQVTHQLTAEEKIKYGSLDLN